MPPHSVRRSRIFDNSSSYRGAASVAHVTIARETGRTQAAEGEVSGDHAIEIAQRAFAWWGWVSGEVAGPVWVNLDLAGIGPGE